MSEKNLNVTVSDFSVYPKPVAENCTISHKLIIRKLKKLFKHISDYDFWVLEHNKKIMEKIKKRNNRRLNSSGAISYTLSAPAFKNCDMHIDCK